VGVEKGKKTIKPKTSPLPEKIPALETQILAFSCPLSCATRRNRSVVVNPKAQNTTSDELSWRFSRGRRCEGANSRKKWKRQEVCEEKECVR
jgi:hypothetical protein